MTLTFDLDLILKVFSIKDQNWKPHVIIFTYSQDIAIQSFFTIFSNFNAKTRYLFFNEISRNEQTISIRLYRIQKSHQILPTISAFREEDFLRILSHCDPVTYF